MPSFLSTNKQAFIYVGLVCVGFLIGLMTMRILSSSEPEAVGKIVHSPLSSGQYTNPILDCEVYPTTQAPVYKELEHTLEKIIERSIQDNKADEIAVYYRDMDTGAWVGVNEKLAFSPASLLKVPILIAYLKQAEKDPPLLTRRLVYQIGESTKTVGLIQNVKPITMLESGKEYSINELLAAMIIDSDNDALYALARSMSISELDEVYLGLGLEIPGIRTVEDFMTVNEYAGFFRILYNSTYLNREMSEEALKLLTQVEYDRGLRPGVPKNIPIAHKFGERGVGYLS